MAARKGSSKPEYTVLGIELVTYRIRLNAAINYEVRDERRRDEDTPVYRFDSSIEIEGTITSPEKRCGDWYKLDLHNSEPTSGDLTSKLADYQVRDEHGMRQYHRVRGKEVPVYKLPHGVGHLYRIRGTKTWYGFAWITSQLMTDMLTVLPHVRPLYLSINECRLERTRWISGLTLQTIDPIDE